MLLEIVRKLKELCLGQEKFSSKEDVADHEGFPLANFSVSTFSNALIRALSQIRVETTTTPEGLIHMMTAGRATCIVFFDDDLPPEGSDHTRPLYISVDCSGCRVMSVLWSLPLPSAMHHLISVPPLRPFARMTVLRGRSWAH